MRLLFGRRDLGDLVIRPVLEIAAVQANANPCQGVRARIRALGFLVEADLLQPRRGLGLTPELPTPARRHCKYRERRCKISFHDCLLPTSGRLRWINGQGSLALFRLPTRCFDAEL